MIWLIIAIIVALIAFAWAWSSWEIAGEELARYHREDARLYRLMGVGAVVVGALAMTVIGTMLK